MNPRVTRRVAPCLLLLLVGVSLTGCRSGGPGPGGARLTNVKGRVEIAPVGRDAWRPVRGGVVHRGERVRALGSDATAVLTLGSGGAMELRDRSVVALDVVPVLDTGDLLAVAARGPLTVAAAGVRVRVEGAARLSRTLAFDAGAYQGALTVTSAGRSIVVPALRRTTVAGVGLVAAVPQPLRYRETDPWDRRYLGDAMALGRDLESRSRGLTGQLGAGEGRTAGFYRLLVPGLDAEPAFDQALLDDDLARSLPPGERLVGTAIALEGRRGGFAERWRSTFAFRDAGAEWGLVVLDQRLADTPRLIGVIDLALDRLGGLGQLAAPPATVAGPGNTTGLPHGTTTIPHPSPTPTTPTTRPTSPATTLPIPEPPSTVPTPGPVGQLLDPLVQAVGGLLNGLLRPPPPQP